MKKHLSTSAEQAACTQPIDPALTAPELAPWRVRIATLAVIVFPFLGIVVAPFLAWGWGFTWTDLGIMLGFYVMTMLGITVGFHRLFTHASFETPTFVKFVLGALGSMAIQGSLFDWVSMHRRHHQFSDTVNDPHSPCNEGKGLLGVIRGAWHAHIGWFFKADPPNMARYIKDLRASRALRVVNALFPLWIVLTLLLPALLGGLISWSWHGALTGLVWGGLVRLFIVHHITWSVNSACHLWGRRPYPSADQSRNNFLFGILAMGEGWHNTHHAFPRSARHGLRWWEIDGSYGIIRLLSWLGLAWDIRLPAAEVARSKPRGRK
jgi:stearoyl-CoA desaturase (delta-9 desaturase)